VVKVITTLELEKEKMASENELLNGVKAKEFGEAWDLAGHEATDQERVHAALSQGFEPFAVTNTLQKVEAQAVHVPGQPPVGSMFQVTTIWFRRKHLVEIQDNVTSLKDLR
jgi:hypothetical protein